MVDLSRDSDPGFTALYDLLGLESPVAKFDAITGSDAVPDVAAFTGFDAVSDVGKTAEPSLPIARAMRRPLSVEIRNMGSMQSVIDKPKTAEPSLPIAPLCRDPFLLKYAI